AEGGQDPTAPRRGAEPGGRGPAVERIDHRVLAGEVLLGAVDELAGVGVDARSGTARLAGGDEAREVRAEPQLALALVEEPVEILAGRRKRFHEASHQWSRCSVAAA